MLDLSSGEPSLTVHRAVTEPASYPNLSDEESDGRFPTPPPAAQQPYKPEAFEISNDGFSDSDPFGANSHPMSVIRRNESKVSLGLSRMTSYARRSPTRSPVPDTPQGRSEASSPNKESLTTLFKQNQYAYGRQHASVPRQVRSAKSSRTREEDEVCDSTSKRHKRAMGQELDGRV